MHLRGVHQKGMAQIDRAGLAGRQRLRPPGSDLVKNQMRHARLSGWRKESRHVVMRTCTYSRRRVFFADIGEQEQHEQSAPP